MKNDTIAKLLKRNNQLSVKTSNVNNSPSLGTINIEIKIKKKKKKKKQ